MLEESLEKLELEDDNEDRLRIQVSILRQRSEDAIIMLHVRTADTKQFVIINLLFFYIYI